MVTSAYVQFTVDGTVNDDPCNLTIYGEASDNADIFANVAYNVTSLTKTSASVSWAPPQWQSVGDAYPAQQTPDLSAIIQEIVNRSGYTAGSSIALIMDGDGRRTAESFDGSTTGAAELCVEYLFAPAAANRPTLPGAGSTMGGQNAASVANAPAGGSPISSIRVVPNPATSRVDISFASNIEGKARIQLRNLAGMVVLEDSRQVEKGSNTIQLQGLNLPGGVYFLQLFAGGSVQSAKLAIAKD
ncbi:MAG: T9SS type A sorting domain-containing protein [Lewinellaceae bacterium]|nr:T9SS type A sorting domain-containing protein [Lewinellaceae bacterium]